MIEQTQTPSCHEGLFSFREIQHSLFTLGISCVGKLFSRQVHNLNQIPLRQVLLPQLHRSAWCWWRLMWDGNMTTGCVSRSCSPKLHCSLELPAFWVALKNAQVPKAELERNTTPIFHKAPLDIQKKLSLAKFGSHSPLRKILILFTLNYLLIQFIQLHSQMLRA